MTTRPRKTVIHVNQFAIRRNIHAAEPEPVLTVKSGRSNTYAHEVEIDGPAKIVYRPTKPLGCGARVWLETYAPVRVVK
jgi:hypothetical protein